MEVSKLKKDQNRKNIYFKIVRGNQFDIIINNTSLRTRIFYSIPNPIMNKILLIFPWLYRTKIVNFETSMSLGNGINELLDKIMENKNVSGDIIECGSARCGTTVIIGNYLKKNNIMKKIYACDSFEGFDKEELKQEKQKGLTQATETTYIFTSYDYVIKKINKLGLSDSIIVVKGFFEKTLPQLDRRFSLALIDCDLEKSINFSSECIWPKLSNGGIMLFDEYNSRLYKGARMAIENFVKKHQNEIEQHFFMNRLYYIKKK